jgi:hypothetical protein
MRTVWKYSNPVNHNGPQTDGEVSNNNALFRCEFYPDTFAAFIGKNLSPKGTLEKNPLPYSCIYENVKPVFSPFSPHKGEANVAPETELTLLCNESVLKSKGEILVYVNSLLQETISVTGNQVSVDGDSIHIGLSTKLPLASRIGIAIREAAFRDSSFNFSEELDSSDWVFHTVDIKPEILSLFPGRRPVRSRRICCRSDSALPVLDVPAPRGTISTSRSLAHLRSSMTCSWLVGCTTARQSPLARLASVQ